VNQRVKAGGTGLRPSSPRGVGEDNGAKKVVLKSRNSEKRLYF
jgi:hypothetical protein